MGIVVALADLPQEHRAGTGFYFEIVIQVLGDENALARGQPDLGTGGDGIGPAIGMNGHVAFVVDGLIRLGIVHPDQHISAAPVDDILGFIPVEVVGGILALLQVQQLLGVDLGILFLHGLAAVADGDEGKTDFVEISLAVIRNVPAQAAVPDLVVFVALRLPLLRGEVAEGRQIAAVFLAHGLQLTKSLVDFGTFHGCLSFIKIPYLALL